MTTPTEVVSDGGWRRARGTPSLAEIYGSIRTRPTGSLWSKLTAFMGPGYLVAVGYMDPATGRPHSLAAPSSVTRC